MNFGQWKQYLDIIFKGCAATHTKNVVYCLKASNPPYQQLPSGRLLAPSQTQRTMPNVAICHLFTEVQSHPPHTVILPRQ